MKGALPGDLPDKVAKRIEKIKDFLVDRLDPSRVILFGSLVSAPEKERGYDIDLMVYGARPLSHREERMLREAVDELAGIYSVDLMWADRVEEDFKAVVELTGAVIYEKDRG